MNQDNTISLREFKAYYYDHFDPKDFAKTANNHRIKACIWGGFAFFAFMMAFRHAIVCGRCQGVILMHGEHLDDRIRKVAKKNGFTLVD